MRATFTESLVHKILFNTVVYGNNETHKIMRNWKTYNLNQLKFGNKLFLLISSDSCHKKMLLYRITEYSFKQSIQDQGRQKARHCLNALCPVRITPRYNSRILSLVSELFNLSSQPIKKSGHPSRLPYGHIAILTAILTTSRMHHACLGV